MNNAPVISTLTVPPNFRKTALQDLRSNLQRMQRGQRQTQKQAVASTGIAALDNILPDRGFPRASLCELIASEAGSGAVELAIRLAARAQSNGPLIIIDRRQQLYAPAIVAAGVCLDSSILIQTGSQADKLWAVEQSLRCPGVGAVLCRIDRLKTQQSRRLQLAAESGTAVGLLLRPETARGQPGWADVRLLVSPRPSPLDSFCRRVEVRLLYAKGCLADQTVELDISDATGSVCLAAGLPDSAAAF